MDQTHRPITAATARRRSLRSTVLGVAAAALVAAWLPFTVFFVQATQHTPAKIVSVRPGSHVIVTRTSGGQLVQSTAPANRSSSLVAQSAPVSSRSS